MSAIAGILVTAMVTPALAVTGIAANNSIGMFENLPSYIKPDALAQKTNIFATQSDGSPILLASVFEQDREEVGWNQISQFVKDAVVSTEDPRFYTHGGVDIGSSLRAVVGNVASGGVESGASTISMQYVKNILVQRADAIQDPTQRQAAYDEATKTSIDRKLKEMKLAIGLEKEYSKDDILLGYLNISSFGGRVYGIQSAAQYYFGVNASDLTLAQAASLIATVNEPNGLRIDEPDNIPLNQARRDKDVLASMLKEHSITQQQYDDAIATPVEPHITEPSTGCVTANGIGAGFFCDYITHIVKNDPAFGADEDTRWENFKTGGYQIYTSLDVDLQKNALESLNNYVPQVSNILNIGSVAVSVEPGTGRVLAMVQNKDFSDNPDVLAVTPTATAVNYSTDFEYGGSTGFQVGSTYKIFTLADWLKNGHSLNEIVNGNSRPFQLSTFRNSCEGSGGGTYQSANDGGEAPGNITVATALQNSVNNAFISMAQKLDQCEIRQTAEDFGVHRADGNQLTDYVSDVLGTNEIAPLTMAEAFAAVAAGGKYCTPVAIDKILDSTGAEVPVPQSTCSQAVDPNIAATMAYAMKGPLNGGTATQSNPNDGIPHIGKTGTTNSEKDTWMVGASTKVATAVWVGNVVGDVSLANNGMATLRHEVWHDYMTFADSKYGGDEFPSPDSKLLQGVSVTVPDVTGRSIDDARTALTAAGFDFQDAGQIDSPLPAGQVASTNPGAGAAVPKGSTIAVFTSNGTLRSFPDVVSSHMSPQQATDAIHQAGIQNVSQIPQKTSDPNLIGKVVGSDPAGGTPVRPTDPTRIFVGAP
jgi:membrane peptidoglycan carboxypeptidase